MGEFWLALGTPVPFGKLLQAEVQAGLRVEAENLKREGPVSSRAVDFAFGRPTVDDDGRGAEGALQGRHEGP